MFRLTLKLIISTFSMYLSQISFCSEINFIDESSFITDQFDESGILKLSGIPIDTWRSKEFFQSLLNYLDEHGDHVETLSDGKGRPDFFEIILFHEIYRLILPKEYGHIMTSIFPTNNILQVDGRIFMEEWKKLRTLIRNARDSHCICFAQKRERKR